MLACFQSLVATAFSIQKLNSFVKIGANNGAQNLITFVGIEQLPVPEDWSSELSCLSTSSTDALWKEKGESTLSLLDLVRSLNWLFK